MTTDKKPKKPEPKPPKAEPKPNPPIVLAPDAFADPAPSAGACPACGNPKSDEKCAACGN